jgi:hypothetical protein
MPAYLLPCSCGQKVRVTNAQAGGEVTCACGRSLAVPTLRGLRDFESAASQTPPKAVLSWSPARGMVFALALLMVAVGILLVIIQLWQYSQVVGYTVDETEEIEQFWAGQIDTLTPDQLMDQWPRIVEEGLGQPNPPQWVVAKRIAAQRLAGVKIGGAIVAVGLLLALATMCVGRRRTS